MNVFFYADGGRAWSGGHDEVLGWDGERTSALVQACESELAKRLQRVQALQSLSAQNQSTSQPHTERETRAKRPKTHTHW